MGSGVGSGWEEGRGWVGQEHCISNKAPGRLRQLDHSAGRKVLAFSTPTLLRQPLRVPGK